EPANTSNGSRSRTRRNPCATTSSASATTLSFPSPFQCTDTSTTSAPASLSRLKGPVPSAPPALETGGREPGQVNFRKATFRFRLPVQTVDATLLLVGLSHSSFQKESSPRSSPIRPKQGGVFFESAFRKRA